MMLRLFLTVSICYLLIACSAQDKKADKKTVAVTDSITIELTAEEAETVLELLQREHTVDSRSSSMGLFVKGIDSIVNSSSAFWVYSVNDSMAKIACDKYMLSPGDKLKWHFRKM